MIYDITCPLEEEMPVWPGDPPVMISPISQLAKGDHANVSRICVATHAGTHVDPPCHFIEGGPTVDQLSLETLIGTADVVYLNYLRIAVACSCARATRSTGLTGTQSSIAITWGSQRRRHAGWWSEGFAWWA